MINETQKRIAAYKAALPGLKERVVAVALLLAMSLTMMASASYAWITLSRSPEVKGLSTNVAANGNLEIALAKPDGSLPAESAIGDSAASQALTAANLTWGNLVNLSDASYGLQAISLRPALLRGYGRTETPLTGADYTADGRLLTTTDRYWYASYEQLPNGTYEFMAQNPDYGVRAIASVIYKNVTGDAVAETLMLQADGKFNAARSMYLAMISSDPDTATKVTTAADPVQYTCMEALRNLLQCYVQEIVDEEMSGTAGADYSPYVTYTYRLIQIFQGILQTEGEGYRALANLQVYKSGKAGEEAEYFKTVDELTALSASGLSQLGVNLTSLTSYKKNCQDIQSSLDMLKDLAVACDPAVSGEKPVVLWAEISPAIALLVDIPTTTINGTEIRSLGARAAIDMVLDKSIKTVVIKGGSLPDTEKRIGNIMGQQQATANLPGVYMEIKAKAMGMTVTVKAAVTTSATKGDHTAADDSVYTESLSGSSSGERVAADTYGMAIDMWVRTNAFNTVLTLEGNLEYETRDATCVDLNGKETTLYTMNSDGTETDVYITADGLVYTINHTELGTQTDLEANGATFKVQTVDVVVGYEGENRVWEDWKDLLDQGLISADSTTQGSGSCYVFYANNEADQIRVLKLLEAFTVVFMDQDGEELATAKLDTEHYYAINGKVTVPLRIVDGVSYKDENGKDQKGIVSLTKNQATWVTALVYLNGEQLQNQDVLEVGEIEGRLNIQYGSSESLTAGKDDDLQSQILKLEAQASYAGQTSYGMATKFETDAYDGGPKKVTVKVTVAEGEGPNSVSGFFVRQINSTQGTKTETVNFRKENGVWIGEFDLTKPGTYVLSSIIADGVEHELEETPALYIPGINITGAYPDLQAGITMTADNSLSSNIVATFSAEVQPQTAYAQYFSQDGKVISARLTRDNADKDKWTGTAQFTASGTYTLRYLVIDGEAYELEADQQVTHILYLGLTTRVYTDRTELSFQYKGEPEPAPMKLKLYTDAGDEITNLSGVNLYYRAVGSAFDQDGMHTQMQWNANTGYYEGNFSIASAGLFQFHRVGIEGENTSTVTKAIVSPAFTVASPYPALYEANATDNYQFVPNGGATMTVQISHAMPTMWAKMTNGTLTQIVACTTNVDDLYTFNVPANANGKQDGNWQITTLYLVNAADEDLNYYQCPQDADGDPIPPTGNEMPGDENYYVIDVTNKGIVSKVVQDVTVTLSSTDGSIYNYVLGKDANGAVVAEFLANQKADTLKITITDFEHMAIQGYSVAPAVTLTWGGEDVQYGGYDGATHGGDQVTLTRVNDTTYTFDYSKFQIAGTYRLDLSFTADGKAYQSKEDSKYKDGLATYEVWSVKPTVTITNVSNKDKSINTQITWTTSLGRPTFTAKTSQINTHDNYSATLYAQATADNSGVARHGYLAEPKLTITFGNIPSTCTASVTLPAGTAKAIEFSRTGSGDVEKEIGKTETLKTFGLSYAEKYTGHGTVEITTMTLTKDGVTYTVTLDNKLTITNPSSVDQS